jgi:hypothetical protein
MAEQNLNQSRAASRACWRLLEMPSKGGTGRNGRISETI